VLRLRPAPVQMTYIGYPNTTGLADADYRIVDSVTDPAGAEAFVTEKLLRLDPCFLCYLPPEGAPEPTTQRASESGVVFGSFNALFKIDDATLELWAQVLRAVPESTLLLKYFGLESAGVREDLLGRFRAAGVDGARIVLDGPGTSAREMMGAYARMDIALDTYPYHGTTTTCEALLMGVPVVTLQGRVCAARVGGSLLGAVGLSELVAEAPEEYVRIAARLAGDVGALARGRAALRERVLASPLCDIPGAAARLGHALRECWRAACASDGRAA
jgi:predicted O-linked N-acetylglucosamine transferase (SPINDLY family)